MSDFVTHSLRNHLKCMGLKLTGHSPGNGLLLEVDMNDDFRVLEATRSLRHGTSSFWSKGDAAKHALRIVSRIRLINLARTTRHDAEGVEAVDLEASSGKTWQSFKNGLSSEDLRLLKVWRGGAAPTQTRDARRYGAEACTHCGAPDPSARHLWAHCSMFSSQRKALSKTYGVPLSWWGSQPKITAKSGWVTYEAHPCSLQRQRLLVMACKMGIEVMSHLSKRRSLPA